jgi:acyl-coenzyme A thioesterase PaaI-like protein
MTNPMTSLAKPLTALIGGPPDLSILGMYRKLAALPAGKTAFTKAVCLKAPYFGSIDPVIDALRPGYCEVHIKDRRAVHNHLGTIHAIAMCNMAELAGGMLTDVSIPTSHRWIPKGMTVEYLAKARGDLRAVAALDPLPTFAEALDLPVTVNVLDRAGTTVMRAVITMRVSPKPAPS